LAFCEVQLPILFHSAALAEGRTPSLALFFYRHPDPDA
jgi:hypothetical protein